MITNNLKPLIRWVGGKSAIVNILLDNSPKEFNTYFEPFVGSAAFLLTLKPQKAILIDLNSELVNFYRIVRRSVPKFLTEMNKKTYRNSESKYYKIRNNNFKKLNSTQRAARFLYLNKTCFNGLWRENKDGNNNVPFGFRKNVSYFDTTNIVNVGRYFRKHCRFYHGDFEKIKNMVKPNDFVYFDPPYLSDNMFSSYTSGGFLYQEHLRLRDFCIYLDKNNVKFLLSNSNNELVRELYKDFNNVEIITKYNVAANPKHRNLVGEVLIKNY